MGKLDGIQNKAIRLALGLRMSTPKNLLLAESKLVQIADRAMYLGTRYCNKILSNSSHFSYGILNKFQRKLALKRNKHKFKSKIIFKYIRNLDVNRNDMHKANKFYVYKVPYEALMFDMDVDVDLGRELQKAREPTAYFRNFLSHRAGSIWYTDGSNLQIEGPWRVGCASYSPEGDVKISRSIEGRASIFSAESVALLNAVETATRASTGDVLVFSDSLSALLTLKSKNFNVDTNPYLLKVKEVCYHFHKDSGGQ